MIDPQDEAHQAEADAIGDRDLPEWAGACATLPPATQDEFDVRMHRHEVEMLVGLLQRLGDPDLVPVAPFAESYRARARTLQDMLDHPLGFWVELTAPTTETSDHA